MRGNTVSRIIEKLSQIRTRSKQNSKCTGPKTGQHVKPSRPNPGLNPPTSGLFQLPVELHMDIIAQLSFSDLCALRRSCRYAASIVAIGDILDHWISRSKPITDLQLHLYPPPTPVTFSYILEQNRRLHIASRLASALDDYIQNHILVHPRTLAPLANPSPEYIEKILPSLLVLQHYLENFAHLWLTLPTTSLQPPRRFEEEFYSRERRVVNTYNGTDLLLDTHKTWLFLNWITLQLLDEGPIKHACGLQSWITSPVFDDFRRYVTFTNLLGFLALLKMKSTHQRRRALTATMHALEPSDNPTGWQESWRRLRLRLDDEGPNRIQVMGMSVMKAQFRDIWTRRAREIFVEEGLMGDDWRKTAWVGTADQAAEFLRDVGGYPFPRSRSPDELNHAMARDRRRTESEEQLYPFQFM